MHPTRPISRLWELWRQRWRTGSSSPSRRLLLSFGIVLFLVWGFAKLADYTYRQLLKVAALIVAGAIAYFVYRSGDALDKLREHNPDTQLKRR